MRSRKQVTRRNSTRSREKEHDKNDHDSPANEETAAGAELTVEQPATA
jgi:hypothetical protein